MHTKTDLSNQPAAQLASATGLDATPWGRPLVSELLESLPDPVIGCDAKGRVVYWSPAAHEAYGYRAEEAIGARVTTLLTTRFPRPLLEILEEVTDLGRWQGRLVHRTKEGHEVAVESRWLARYGDAGKLVGGFAFEREIAAASRVRSGPAPEEPTHTGQQRLRQAERLDSLGQLADSVAHDFNNALAIILNYASFVSAEVQRMHSAPTEAQRSAMRQDLDEISAAAARAATLSNQLLAFSQHEVDEPQPVDLNSHVEEIQPLLTRTLPALGDPHAAGAAGNADRRIPVGAGTILLVEHERPLADIARRILVSAGYEVIVAGDEPEALDLAGAHEGTIDLLLTDVVMPGSLRPQLADRLRAPRPAMAVAYMSGHSESSLGPADQLGPPALIAKPFTAPVLLAHVARILAERDETLR